MRLVLKNVQVNNRMSEETTNFSASLYLDGIKVGVVSNDGRGGCNRYAFENVEAREAFAEYVSKWAAEKRDMFEPDDALVAAALERWEAEKRAKANHKKGFVVTLICRRGKDEMGWLETFIVGLRSETHIEPFVKSERIEEYERITVEPPAQTRGRSR